MVKRAESGREDASVFYEPQISMVAREIALSEPVAPGNLIICGATPHYRTKDSRYFRTCDSRTFALTADDSYVLAGLVPGEPVDVIGNIGVRSPRRTYDAEMEELFARMKYHLLAVTDPISFDRRRPDWHTLLALYGGVLTARQIARKLGRGIVTFESHSGKELLRLGIIDGNVHCAIVARTHGLMDHFGALLSQHPNGAGRVDRLVAADSKVGDTSAVKMALVACQLAEEVQVNGTVVDMSGIRNSQIISSLAPKVCGQDVERAVGLLAENEFDGLLECRGLHVRIGKVWCDLSKAKSLEEEVEAQYDDD